MIHVRPYQLLQMYDEFDEKINFFMPQAEAAGSMTTLESIMLLKLMRCIDPIFAFEFGTYKGLTTRLLLANLRPRSDVSSGRIVTLDLPDTKNIHFQGTDEQIAAVAVRYERKYLASPDKHLVKQLLQDSMTFDSSPYEKRFQYILIDGNHEITYVKKDTENAFVMMAGPPSCIIWHDYGNAEFPELTEYLEDLSAQTELHHIEETMLVFHLLGRHVAPRKISR